MVSELKKSIENGKVFFGVKQSLKNYKVLNMVRVPSDCRQEIVNLLKEKNIKVEEMNLTKHELADKLELDFPCEVFGLRR